MKFAILSLLFCLSVHASENVNFNPIIVFAHSADEENTTLADFITFQQQQVRVLLPSCSYTEKLIFCELLGAVFYDRDVQELYDREQKRYVAHYFLHRKKIAQLINMLKLQQSTMISTHQENRHNYISNLQDADKVTLLAYFGYDSEPMLIKPQNAKNLTIINIAHRMNTHQYSCLYNALNKFYNDGAGDVPTPIDIENLKTIHDLLE
jgi:hypothetical protein